MRKVVALSLMLAGCATFVFATPVGAPEIDPSTGAGALVLLSGALVVLRSRLRR